MPQFYLNQLLDRLNVLMVIVKYRPETVLSSRIENYNAFVNPLLPGVFQEPCVFRIMICYFRMLLAFMYYLSLIHI